MYKNQPILTMPDDELEVYLRMHPKEPFILAALGTGKNGPELAEALDWGETFLYRVLNDLNFYPRFEKIADFCRITGSSLPLLWLMAHSSGKTEHKSLDIDAASLMRSMVELQEQLGKAGSYALEATADNELEEHELKKQIKTLAPLLGSALELDAQLRASLKSAKQNKISDNTLESQA